jgi:hypothetical protein
MTIDLEKLTKEHLLEICKQQYIMMSTIRTKIDIYFIALDAIRSKLNNFINDDDKILEYMRTNNIQLK